MHLSVFYVRKVYVHAFVNSVLTSGVPREVRLVQTAPGDTLRGVTPKL